MSTHHRKPTVQVVEMSETFALGATALSVKHFEVAKHNMAMANNQMTVGIQKLMTDLRGRFAFDVKSGAWLLTFRDGSKTAPVGAVYTILKRQAEAASRPMKKHPVRKVA